MYASNDPNSPDYNTIKVADFGLAKFVSESSMMKTTCGTVRPPFCPLHSCPHFRTPRSPFLPRQPLALSAAGELSMHWQRCGRRSRVLARAHAAFLTSTASSPLPHRHPLPASLFAALTPRTVQPGYVAPEVLDPYLPFTNGYGPEVDLWSLGVVLYIM